MTELRSSNTPFARDSFHLSQSAESCRRPRVPLYCPQDPPAVIPAKSLPRTRYAAGIQCSSPPPWHPRAGMNDRRDVIPAQAGIQRPFRLHGVRVRVWTIALKVPPVTTRAQAGIQRPLRPQGICLRRTLTTRLESVILEPRHPEPSPSGRRIRPFHHP